jgi:hypothetical protein
VLWKALPEHNPTKLDSAQDSSFTASYDFSNLITPYAILITTARL